MSRYLVLFFCVSMVFGCSSGLFITKVDGPVIPGYISGVDLPKGISAEKIEDNLTRKNGIVAGYYRAEVIPITEASIGLRNEELAKRKMLSKTQSDAELEKQRSAFLKDKSCFTITVLSMGPIETASLERYMVRGKSDGSDIVDLSFGESAKKSVPSYETSQSGTVWYNIGIACGKKVDLMSGFTLFVIPDFEDSRIKDQRIEMRWSPPAKDQKGKMNPSRNDFIGGAVRITRMTS